MPSDRKETHQDQNQISGFPRTFTMKGNVFEPPTTSDSGAHVSLSVDRKDWTRVFAYFPRLVGGRRIWWRWYERRPNYFRPEFEERRLG